MTTEQKAKAYDEAIKRAKQFSEHPLQEDSANIVEYIFPELKESEDERIRKSIISGLKYLETELGWDALGDVDILDAYDWLEKQGEKKPIIEMKSAEESLGISSKEYNEIVNDCLYNDESKPTPRFHEGDWITNGDYTWKIVEVKPLDYILQSQDGNIVDDTISYVDKHFHSFTIEDVMDGDVLVASDGSIFLFAGVDDCACKYYVALTTDNYVKIYNEEAKDGGYWETSRAVYPATKEQRDLLFQKMNEAGYEWNAELKKVSKITTPADVGFAELGKAWAEEANKQNLANSAKTCKKSQRMISAEAKEALYDKPAWSEEDEKNLQGIINAIKELRCQSLLSEIEIYDDYIDWLKSLKQKYAWKPSDEQMDALETLYDNLKRL